MGKTFQRKDRNPDDWYITYMLPSGQRKKERIGPSKKLAEAILKKREVEIAEGRHLDIKKQEKIRFSDFSAEYLETHSKTNNRSWQKTDAKKINQLNKHFGGYCLHEITPLIVERYKSERRKQVSPATVNRDLACLKSIYNKAIKWEKFDGKNPVQQVKLFKENNKRLRYLEKEEIGRLLASCEDHLKPIVLVALHTGMRLGEILNLKWHDVDFNREVVHLEETKSGERRELPINSVVRGALIAVRKHPESPYIFCHADGKSRGSVKKAFSTALSKSGIKHFRFHDLRHSFASHLVMSGVDLNTVRELLGHRTLEMTLRYAHLSPDHKRRAVDLLREQLDQKASIFVPTTSPEQSEPTQAHDTNHVTSCISIV